MQHAFERLPIAVANLSTSGFDTNKILVNISENCKGQMYSAFSGLEGLGQALLIAKSSGMSNPPFFIEQLIDSSGSGLSSAFSALPQLLNIKEIDINTISDFIIGTCHSLGGGEVLNKMPEAINAAIASNIDNPLELLNIITQLTDSMAYDAIANIGIAMETLSKFDDINISQILTAIAINMPNQAGKVYSELPTFVDFLQSKGVENMQGVLLNFIMEGKTNLPDVIEKLPDMYTYIESTLNPEESTTSEILATIIKLFPNKSYSNFDPIKLLKKSLAIVAPDLKFGDVLQTLKEVAGVHLEDVLGKFDTIISFCDKYKIKLENLINDPVGKDSQVILGINPSRFSDNAYEEIVLNRLPKLRPAGYIDNDRPVALIVYSESDWNGAFEGHSKMVDDLVAQGYKVVYHEISEDSQLVDSIKELGDTKEKASLLVIGGHGASIQTNFGNVDPAKGTLADSEELSLGFEDFDQLDKENWSDYLESDAQCILVSCSTGFGKSEQKNMANFLANIFGINVHAPTETSTFTGDIEYTQDGKVLEVAWGNGVEGYVATPDAESSKTAAELG